MVSPAPCSSDEEVSVHYGITSPLGVVIDATENTSDHKGVTAENTETLLFNLVYLKHYQSM